MLDDALRCLLAGEEEGSYRWRNRFRDPCDLIVRDRSRTGGHFRDQAYGGGSETNSVSSLRLVGNAADLDVRDHFPMISFITSAKSNIPFLPTTHSAAVIAP